MNETKDNLVREIEVERDGVTRDLEGMEEIGVVIAHMMTEIGIVEIGAIPHTPTRLELEPAHETEVEMSAHKAEKD